MRGVSGPDGAHRVRVPDAFTSQWVAPAGSLD